MCVCLLSVRFLLTSLRWPPDWLQLTIWRCVHLTSHQWCPGLSQAPKHQNTHTRSDNLAIQQQHSVIVQSLRSDQCRTRPAPSPIGSASTKVELAKHRIGLPSPPGTVNPKVNGATLPQTVDHCIEGHTEMTFADDWRRTARLLLMW